MANKKTRKSRTGAQFYQSDAEKEARLAAGAERTKTEKAIAKALKEKFLSGDISRKEYIDSGVLQADIFLDSIEDAIKRPPKAKGGTVRPEKRYMNGGMIMSGRGVRDTKMS
jgi:hypothetical protein